MATAVAMPKGHVFTGARAQLKVGNQVIGYATGCAGTEEITYEPLTVLDHIQVIEFVPIGYFATFTASRVRIIGAPAGAQGSLRGMDLYPKLGKDDAEFLANILALASKGDMTCQISDSKSGLVFMDYQQVVIASHSWSIGARGIVGEDITFLGVRMLDEADV